MTDIVYTVLLVVALMLALSLRSGVASDQMFERKRRETNKSDKHPYTLGEGMLPQSSDSKRHTNILSVFSCGVV